VSESSLPPSPTPGELAATLRLFHAEGQVFEIRILGPLKGSERCIISGYFDDPSRAVLAIERWDGCATGLYFTPNPVCTAALARSAHRLKEWAKHTTTDRDISARRWLLIDFDPRRPTGVSSTEEEHGAALERARDCRSFLSASGFSEPILADSGNGAHLLYPIDLPNDEVSTRHVQRFLGSLDLLFSDATVAVDRATYNAARLSKLYGTLARKGDFLPERPHRRSALLDVPESLLVVPPELLESLAADAPGGIPGSSRIPQGCIDLDKWIVAHGLHVLRQGPWNGGQKWVIAVCPWNAEHNDGGAYIVQFANGVIAAGCHHEGCRGKDWKDLRHLVEGPEDSIPPYKGGAGNESNFRPLKASELLSLPERQLVWVWHSYLPEGTLALLVAFMKVGKSTFAYALAVAVAQGKPFLDYPTLQGGVLILAVEEHRRDVLRRLQRFGMRSEDPLYVHSGPLDRGELQKITEFIREKRIRLVILDTLSRFWSVFDENDNAEIDRAVSPLLYIARETKAVVLLVHHERKVGGEAGRNIRGGSALFAIVDQALMLDKRQGGTPSHRVIRALGRYEETPAELILDLAGDKYQMLGKPEEADLEAIKAKVRAALSRSSPLAIDQIVESTGLTKGGVEKGLANVADVVRAGRGVKGDPYRFRLSGLAVAYPRPQRASRSHTASDAIRSQPDSIGEETNPPAGDASPQASDGGTDRDKGTRNKRRGRDGG